MGLLLRLACECSRSKQVHQAGRWQACICSQEPGAARLVACKRVSAVRSLGQQGCNCQASTNSPGDNGVHSSKCSVVFSQPSAELKALATYVWPLVIRLKVMRQKVLGCNTPTVCAEPSRVDAWLTHHHPDGPGSPKMRALLPQPAGERVLAIWARRAASPAWQGWQGADRQDACARVPGRGVGPEGGVCSHCHLPPGGQPGGSAGCGGAP